MPYSLRIQSQASQDRLEKLIEARLQPGTDKQALDERIWDLFGETWAVMFTDLAGFSRRVNEFGIIHFLQTIFESQRLLIPCIDAYDGILLKQEGDSLLVIFKRPQKALECALAMQHALTEYNAGLPEVEQVLLCVGLGYGPVLKIGDADVFGTEVNASSKLGEDIAKAGEILITESVRAAVSVPDIHFEALNTVPPGAGQAWKVLY
ncbi:adenylate cyclase [bacterium (Candidatus Blackallbacteria) CG13_big_fil_rev_8_21_14_2_50_49_14]|nr:MAG: adenylate cyclase [bacterium (Candidatus Blackallbacteria) CG18_big_fil_WC_8_21_14_2_50_49_26]PIW46850.1 MAG: adenylate cyclase [bacterium (Candidatus Blackallbacteria) CG13_big_fil_rev_8_21_14_2_50_49_14]